jgi:hypothetical protein
VINAIFLRDILNLVIMMHDQQDPAIVALLAENARQADEIRALRREFVRLVAASRIEPSEQNTSPAQRHRFFTQWANAHAMLTEGNDT